MFNSAKRKTSRLGIIAKTSESRPKGSVSKPAASRRRTSGVIHKLKACISVRSDRLCNPESRLALVDHLLRSTCHPRVPISFDLRFNLREFPIAPIQSRLDCLFEIVSFLSLVIIC